MDSNQSLYDKAEEYGCTLDSHESDLYLLATPLAYQLVRESGRSWSTFVSQVDGKVWIDVPFAYLPWWRARQAEGGAR